MMADEVHRRAGDLLTSRRLGHFKGSSISFLGAFFLEHATRTHDIPLTATTADPFC